MNRIDIRKEKQLNPVADDVSALIAVARPILQGLLFSLKKEIAGEVGGYEKVKLKLLPRLRLKGDGDCGICYEYAVHDAIGRNDALIKERVFDAMTKYCKVPGKNVHSILFGAEKTGTVQLIDTAKNILTEESRLLTGKRAQPPKLKAYLNMLAAAFSRESTRKSLPTSINGLWKADLFLGCTDSDRWVGTTVKINPKQLEAANGLRIGIVPAAQGKSDKIIIDESKNLVVCPLPYDASFMEVFYNAWGIIQQFLQADAFVPKEVALPIPSHRHVAKLLEQRREFPVVDIVEALAPLSQPELLENRIDTAGIIIERTSSSITDTIISPISRETIGMTTGSTRTPRKARVR